MTYSQKANPNATNSELDAKVIIKHPTLTRDQEREVIEQFVELVVDGMDTKTLVAFVTDQLTENLEELLPFELKDQIDNYDEDLYEELAENVQVDDLCKEVSDCVVNTNGAYAECVDRLVESMNIAEEGNIKS